MNTGRFRMRRNCCFAKHNQTISDLRNSTHYPCGVKPENEVHLIKHYKSYINRGLEHLPYLEKKSHIVRQRNMLKKKPATIERTLGNSASCARASKRLRNL